MILHYEHYLTNTPPQPCDFHLQFQKSYCRIPTGVGMAHTFLRNGTRTAAQLSLDSLGRAQTQGDTRCT